MVLTAAADGDRLRGAPCRADAAKGETRAELTFTIDRDFSAVIRACAARRGPIRTARGSRANIVEAYTRFHDGG